MKNWATLSLFLGVLLLSSQAHAACDFQNPHSFDCQHDTFAGAIFPMIDVVGTSALSGSWFANQYTPGSRQGEGLFQTLISRSNRMKTCAVLNDDGSRVGNLRIAVTGRGVRAAQVANFRSEDFLTNRPGGFEDSKTVVFANTSTDQIFKCRVFERASTKHLTCQYFESRQFMGYVGFLPFETDCR